ncbi:MAG: phosphoribosylamine--glycine ligase [Candidatus Promineifilaceae bacterium]
MAQHKVLVVGSGGREHTLAWKLVQSAQVAHVFVAPGNGGTASMANVSNVPIGVGDLEKLATFAAQNAISLTIVGPEAPLAAGIVDLFQARGLRIYGPTQAAAQLESSKAYAKAFMQDVGIPTAAAGTFSEFEAAKAYLDATFSAESPIVIKASGLAAGKGVIMCANRVEAEQALQDMMLDAQFGTAGSTVVIEQCLFGPEVSVIGLSDGKTIVPLIASRDHKRAYDNDEGPNTGGMGAFAPPPDLSQESFDDIVQSVLQKAVDGMAARGIPYVGTLYAGMMLTADGAFALEFNCRFGDPETQVILPMLKNDLFDLFWAGTEQRLDQITVEMHEGACAAVVMAAPGYPNSYPKGLLIEGVDTVNDGAEVFHAGTVVSAENTLHTSGGRVLAVSARGANLDSALARAYAGVASIQFENAHYRRDIGRRGAETK